MIFVKDLFKKQNILCPSWLADTPLEDEWEDADYTVSDSVHTWRVTDELRDVEIRFDGVTYTMGAYRDGAFYLLNECTEDYSVIV